VGVWHLKIDALDINQKTVYIGESDIAIIENITIDIAITMFPTSAGTGSINISLNWTTTCNTWLDYQLNPIFTPDNSFTQPNHVQEPKVIFDNGKFKMWYMNIYNAGKADISYAESKDGIHWLTVVTEAVLTPSEAGKWDDYTVSPGPVIKEDGQYKMYYNGWHDQSEMEHIGLAVSADGIHWEKQNSPVLQANSIEYRLTATSIVKKDGVYFLFYSYKPQYSIEFRICLATSSDGLNFTRYQGNPILVPTKSWEGYGLLYATVIYEDGLFKMIYNNEERSAFGLATSTDGYSWTKKISNPVFKVENTTINWCSNITYCNLIHSGNKYFLYYGGLNNGINKIGVALNNIL